jgi:hypothetical protein
LPAITPAAILAMCMRFMRDESAPRVKLDQPVGLKSSPRRESHLDLDVFAPLQASNP